MTESNRRQELTYDLRDNAGGHTGAPSAEDLDEAERDQKRWEMDVNAGAETTWNDNEDDGTIGGTVHEDERYHDKMDRMWALQNDRKHPEAEYENYYTPHGSENQHRRERMDSIELALSNIWTPDFVTEDAVADQLRQHDGEIESTYASYGGIDFMVAVAITEVWGESERNLWIDRRFMDDVEEWLEWCKADEVTIASVKQKLFAVREVDQDESDDLQEWLDWCEREGLLDEMDGGAMA